MFGVWFNFAVAVGADRLIGMIVGEDEQDIGVRGFHPFRAGEAGNRQRKKAARDLSNVQRLPSRFGRISVVEMWMITSVDYCSQGVSIASISGTSRVSRRSVRPGKRADRFDSPRKTT